MYTIYVHIWGHLGYQIGTKYRSGMMAKCFAFKIGFQSWKESEFHEKIWWTVNWFVNNWPFRRKLPWWIVKETSGTALSQFLPDAFAAHILILKCLQRGEKVSAMDRILCFKFSLISRIFSFTRETDRKMKWARSWATCKNWPKHQGCQIAKSKWIFCIS